jgi:hypothetical protein
MSRLSRELPKRQRVRRASSKTSESILVCANLSSPAKRSKRSKSSRGIVTVASAGVSWHCGGAEISGASSMAAIMPSRARAREMTFPYGQALRKVLG